MSQTSTAQRFAVARSTPFSEVGQGRAGHHGYCFLQGGTSLPYPKPGYWAAADSSLGNASKRVQLFNNNETVYEKLGLLFFQCGTSRGASKCVGGKQFLCTEGYMGRLCNTCRPGQFYWMGSCSTSCQEMEPRGLTTVVSISAEMFAWWFFYKMTSGSYAVAASDSSVGWSAVIV